MVSCTIFNNIYDNQTDKRMDYESFEQFETILYRLAESDKYPTKSEAPLISPAVYLPDSTRANDNVVSWGGFGILDVDDFTGNIKEIEKQYERFKYVCYSTASSHRDKPRFRLVFPLDRFVEKDEIKHFWFAINKEIGGIADAQTKDLSRMYYIPAKYKKAFNFIFSHDGDIMNVDNLLEANPYYQQADNFFDRLPEGIQKGLIEHRKNQLKNSNYSWTNYLDCPFVNQTQVNEYKSIQGTGWYSQMYKIMVSPAGKALNKGYPITAKEVAHICRTLDNDTGNWYLKRDMEKEADRAIEFVFRNQGL